MNTIACVSRLLGAPPAGAPQLSASILTGLERLRAADIGPFFIWMFDEPWRKYTRGPPGARDVCIFSDRLLVMTGLLSAFWTEAESLLGGACVLEPTFAAYHLNPKKAREAKGKYVGTNFGLPHRDYTFTDSHSASGKPKILTMWVPVTPVTSENGCMYVVPKEFDENYDRDSVYEHMVVQTTGWMAGKSHLSFPVAGARPLAPAPAGSICAWYGNVIHWGAHCHVAEEDAPRASVAWVFRLASSALDSDNPPLTRAEVEGGMSLEKRRQLLLRSMDCFQHWTGAGNVSGEDVGQGYGGKAAGGGGEEGAAAESRHLREERAADLRTMTPG